MVKAADFTNLGPEVSVKQTGLPVSTEVMLWNEAAPDVTPRRLHKMLSRDMLPTKIQVEISNGVLKVNFAMYNPASGKKIGFGHFLLPSPGDDKSHLYLSNIEISDTGWRGKHIARQLLPNLVDIAKASGEKEIQLKAQDMGGLIWPYYYFSPTQQAWNELRKWEVKKRLNGMKRYLRTLPEGKEVIADVTRILESPDPQGAIVLAHTKNPLVPAPAAILDNIETRSLAEDGKVSIAAALLGATSYDAALDLTDKSRMASFDTLTGRDDRALRSHRKREWQRFAREQATQEGQGV